MNYGVEGMPPSFPAGKADLLSTEQKARVLFDLRKLPLRSLAAPCVEPRSRRRRSYIDPLRGFRRGSRRLSSFFLSKSCSSMWLRTVVRWWKTRTTFKRRTVPRAILSSLPPSFARSSPNADRHGDMGHHARRGRRCYEVSTHTARPLVCLLSAHLRLLRVCSSSQPAGKAAFTNREHPEDGVLMNSSAYANKCRECAKTIDAGSACWCGPHTRAAPCAFAMQAKLTRSGVSQVRQGR